MCHQCLPPADCCCKVLPACALHSSRVGLKNGCEAGWRWGTPHYPGQEGVLCASCDPANELNRLHGLQSLLLGFHSQGGIWECPDQCKNVHKEMPLLAPFLFESVLSRILVLLLLKSAGKLLCTPTGMEALLVGVTLACWQRAGMLLLPPARCARQNPPPSLAQVCW